MDILIIEDEKNLARFIELELKDSGFNPEIASDGQTGLEMALKKDYSVIVLDWMLPEKDGVQVLKEIKSVKDTPVIMITAKNSVDSEVESLTKGADDYLRKPFDNRQLLARIQSLLRRSPVKKTIEKGQIKIDSERREVRNGSEIIDLSKTEFDLLYFFLNHQDQVMTRDMILEQCWNYSVDTNVIDVYVNRLRKKLNNTEIIRTVRGVGYIADG